jgi:competence protein ComFC
MHKLNKIIGIVFDFLFPKSELDLAIEKETPETLANKLLQGRETENKSIYALFDYRDEVVRHMIWALKYRRNRQIAKTFAILLYDFLIEEFSDLNVYSDFDKPLLIPIPLFKKRFRERGFNQNELLAKELCKINENSLCILNTAILQKIKNTPHQTNLRRHKRLKNIIGAFSIKNPEKIKNRNIVLLDDVTTTGATLAEARKVLLKAGAKKVISVAVAH